MKPSFYRKKKGRATKAKSFLLKTYFLLPFPFVPSPLSLFFFFLPLFFILFGEKVLKLC